MKHDPWNLRFVLFVPAALWLATAMAAARRPWLTVAAVPVLIVQLFGGLRSGDLSEAELKILWETPWRERSYGKCCGAWSDKDAVAYYGFEPVSNRGESYLLYGPDFSRRVVYPAAGGPWERIEAMRAAGVERTYVSRRAERHANPIDDCASRGMASSDEASNLRAGGIECRRITKEGES